MKSVYILLLVWFVVACTSRESNKIRGLVTNSAMVVSAHPVASQVGAAILKKGGNAVDAAVATAFALAVVEPAAGNIGGGGFMLVRLADGRTTFFDYREMAPGRASRDMYIAADGKLDPEASTIGYKSVAVPGTVAGLELALKTYGTMKTTNPASSPPHHALDAIQKSAITNRPRIMPVLVSATNRRGAF